MQKYKERLNECHALAPVECNAQVLDALKNDANKADFPKKEVIKTATVIRGTQEKIHSEELHPGSTPMDNKQMAIGVITGYLLRRWRLKTPEAREKAIPGNSCESKN